MSEAPLLNPREEKQRASWDSALLGPTHMGAGLSILPNNHRSVLEERSKPSPTKLKGRLHPAPAAAWVEAPNSQQVR